MGLEEITLEPGEPEFALHGGGEFRGAGRMPYRQHGGDRTIALPHVAMVSGGRSSAMMAVLMARSGALRRERGDCATFQNTGAEHPATYRFLARVKAEMEEIGIPFYLMEFCTVEREITYRGETAWRRAAAYRLCNDRPHDPGSNPDGYRWRGEPFREMMSWRGYMPSRFARACTEHLKIDVKKMFIHDWLSGAEGTETLGHGGPPRADWRALYESFLRHRPKRAERPVGWEAFWRKKSARGGVASAPTSRPAQRFGDFSAAWTRQPATEDIEWVSCIGIRGDEMRRAMRLLGRYRDGGANWIRGEHPVLPLVDIGCDREGVLAWWARQRYDLELPPEAAASNCAFCFMKGVRGVARAQRELIATDTVVTGTPTDIRWWAALEDDFAWGDDGKFGFFSAAEGGSYTAIADTLLTDGGATAAMAAAPPDMPPCDCTD